MPSGEIVRTLFDTFRNLLLSRILIKQTKAPKAQQPPRTQEKKTKAVAPIVAANSTKNAVNMPSASNAMIDTTRLKTVPNVDPSTATVRDVSMASSIARSIARPIHSAPESPCVWIIVQMLVEQNCAQLGSESPFV